MAIEYLTQGTAPAVETNVSNAEMINYIVLDNVVYPGHGKIFPIASPGKSRAVYNSSSQNCLYVVNADEFGCLDEIGIFSLLGRINTKNSNVSIAVNPASQVLIADGDSCYVYSVSPKSFFNLSTIPSFSITNPVSAIMVDTIFFVAGGRQVQASEPNNGLAWDSDTFAYESGEDEIVALAVIDRVIFFISQFNIERWVINQSTAVGAPLLVRDNVFLIESGLTDSKSFVNDFNIAIGLFSSRSGGDGVRMLTRGSNDLIDLTTPGLIRKMRSMGEVDSATLYEITGIRYYEITFKSSEQVLHSFIYNFSNKKWSESTQPSQKVGSVGNVSYAANGSNYFRISEYRNNLVKKIRTSPVNFPGDGATLTEAMLRVKIKESEDILHPIRLGGYYDGINRFSPRDHYLVKGAFIQNVSSYPRIDVLSYDFLVETQSNCVLTDLTYKVTQI